MRRVVAAAAAVLMILTLSCLPAHAAGEELSLDYVPRTERGTLFYLDLSYSGSLSAAMLELSYDRSLVEYRDIAAAADTTTVKAKDLGGTLRIVLGDSDRVGGELCRLTFKAVGSGDAAFVLRMTEGVDGDLNHTAIPPACELTVTFGGSSASVSSSTRRGSDHVGSPSSKTAAESDQAATGDERPARTTRDLSTDGSVNLMLAGFGAGVLGALLAILGFLIGKRCRSKKKPAVNPDGEDGRIK